MVVWPVSYHLKNIGGRVNQQTSTCASGFVVQAQLRDTSLNSEDSGLNIEEKQESYPACYPESLSQLVFPRIVILDVTHHFRKRSDNRMYNPSPHFPLMQ